MQLAYAILSANLLFSSIEGLPCFALLSCCGALPRRRQYEARRSKVTLRSFRQESRKVVDLRVTHFSLLGKIYLMSILNWYIVIDDFELRFDECCLDESFDLPGQREANFCSGKQCSSRLLYMTPLLSFP